MADRINFGANKVVTIGTAGKIALLLFDILQGDRVSLKLWSSTMSSGAISIHDPLHDVIATRSFSGSSSFVEPVDAAVAGTFHDHG